MKKFAIQMIFLFIVMVIALLFIFNRNFQDLVLDWINGGNQLQEAIVQVGGTSINVEIADSSDERSRGLSGRESLASNAGMLFVYDKPGRYRFWMKGMKFPLDFIWINDGRVVDLTANVLAPEPNQPDASLPIIESSQDVTSILEVNSGFISANNIQIGDSVSVEKK